VKIDAVIDHGLRWGDAIARMWGEKNRRVRGGKGTVEKDFETEG